MSPLDILIVAFVVVCAGLAALVTLRTEMTRARGGKILAFVALFLLPALSVWAGLSTQMERATTTFCLSCHVMTDYGRSLLIDDPSYIAAVHFQNNRVPRDRACYTCHRPTRSLEAFERSSTAPVMCMCSTLDTFQRQTRSDCMTPITIASACTVTTAPGSSSRCPHTSRRRKCSATSSPVGCRACRVDVTIRCTTSEHCRTRK